MTTAPELWDWDASTGPARLRELLATSGLAWMRRDDPEAARLDPWAFAESLLGERPLLVESQPIRAIVGGRSYSSGSMAAPWHTDSQCLLGVPAALQVMVCVQPAATGGECLFLDTWPLLEQIEQREPALFARLFEETRRQPFVFGAVEGPTLALRGGHLVFTHSAIADDDVARRLRPHVDAAASVALAPEPGDVIVASNHRLLHGRSAFADLRREFTRLLVWPGAPLPIPQAWRGRAREQAAVWGDPATLQRLQAVLALLRAIPAGMLSARGGVSEERLYAWRDAALRGMLAALARDR